MAENLGGSVSAADPPSSNLLIHLYFGSNSDSDFLSSNYQNIEAISGVSSEKVMAALFGSEKPDGSLPKSNHPSPDCLSDLNSGPNTNPEPEFVSPSSAYVTPSLIAQLPFDFDISLPDPVTLGRKLPVSVPLDNYTNSLRGTADDGGNGGKVERKADEVIGIHVGTQRDEEMVVLMDHPSFCESSESTRDEIQHKSTGSLNAENHQVNCKSPEIGMRFSSEEAAYEFYKNYARNIGFCVRKGKVQRLANGKVRKKYFFCSRQGFRLKKRSNETTKYKRKETRIGCEAMIQFTIENGEWVVSNLNLQHNHEHVNSSQMCESRRNISDAHEILDSISEAGMEKDAADAQNEEFHGMLKRWTRYAKEGEVHDWGEETTDERKRSLSLDTSKLMQKAFNLITKCGANKDTWAIAEQYLNSALEKVNEHLKREKYLPNKRKGKEVDDLEDDNEVAGSNTCGFGCLENQKMVLSSPCDDRDGILKSTRISKMKKRHQNVKRQRKIERASHMMIKTSAHHQPVTKVAREHIGIPSTRRSFSQVEGCSTKHANTCPQTQTPSTSTSHYLEVPIMTKDMQLPAPPNVQTSTHYNQGRAGSISSTGTGAGKNLSFGMSTEAFQFDISPASAPGTIVPASLVANNSSKQHQDSTDLNKEKNWRISPILTGSTLNNFERHVG